MGAEDAKLESRNANVRGLPHLEEAHQWQHPSLTKAPVSTNTDLDVMAKMSMINLL
jgi:hypothetical protein